MANGSVGNSYYIDSGGLTVSLKNAKIQSIAFAANDTTSTIQLSFSSDTSQIIYKQTSPNDNPVTLSTYLGGVWFNETIFVNTLTAGTAWLYFS